MLLFSAIWRWSRVDSNMRTAVTGEPGRSTSTAKVGSELGKKGKSQKRIGFRRRAGS